VLRKSSTTGDSTHHSDQQLPEEHVADLQAEGGANKTVHKVFHSLSLTLSQVTHTQVQSLKCVCKAGTVIETRSHVASASTKGEILIKGYMVSSVNEWGFDQTRILLVLRL
jgi:hypothetical protein